MPNWFLLFLLLRLCISLLEYSSKVPFSKFGDLLKQTELDPFMADRVLFLFSRWTYYTVLTHGTISKAWW